MRAIVITRMMLTGPNRGRPAVVGGNDISFVHIGSEPLWDAWKAFVVTGTGAALTALDSDVNFLAGQEITWNADGEFANWSDSRTAIQSGAKTKINNVLATLDEDPLGPDDSIVDLIQIRQPDFNPGADNVHDAYV